MEHLSLFGDSTAPRPRARLLVALLLAFLAFPGGGRRSARGVEPDVSTESIWAAWSEREKATRSADFEWTERRVVMAGSRPGRAGATNRPEQDVSLSSPGIRMRFQGQSLYYETELDTDFDDLANRKPHRWIVCFDGETHLNFQSGGDGDISGPSAGIGKPATFDGYSNQYTYPVLLPYRAASLFGALGLRAADFRISPERPVSGGQACLAVEAPRPTGNVTDVLWLDPSKDYLPVLYALRATNFDLMHVTIAYSKDEKRGWRPESWKIVERVGPKGTLLQTTQARVDSWTLNEPIPASRLTVEFPPGAVIFQENRMSVVRLDGTLREITIEERKGVVTIDEIVDEELGRNGTGGLTRLWRNWRAAAIGTAGVVALALLLWRRRRQRTRSQ